MDREKKYLFKDGHEILPSWLPEFELETATIVNSSKKKAFCTMGCAIPEKSTYLNLSIKHCAGCAGEMVTLAICSNHLDALKKNKPDDFLDTVSFDELMRLLESSNY